MITLIVCGWLLSAVLTAGIEFAYFQGRFPLLAVDQWRRDLGHAITYGLLFGPIALVLSFLLSDFGQYGWRLWPAKRKP